MAKRPPYNPPPTYRPPPAASPPPRPGGRPPPGMQQIPMMQQALVITPRVRATVDDEAVEAATMLPTDD